MISEVDDKTEASKLLEEFSKIMSEGLPSKKWHGMYDEIRCALNVGIEDFFQREAYRVLRQFGGLDCEIYMVPSYGQKDILELNSKIKMKDFDFRITASGKIYNLKIMIQENSPCSILLCEDFANKIIKSVNPRQNYKKFNSSEVKLESLNFTYTVELKGQDSELLILNIQEV